MVCARSDFVDLLSVLARAVNLFVRFVVWIARLRFRLLVHVQAEDRVVHRLLSSDGSARAWRIMARRTGIC